jgi:fructose-1,6-bisphosphatase/inositol monophosphatase family enzyme
MLDIVTELLADAGQVLIAHRSAERTIERKSSHWTLVSDADRAAEECMIDNLRRLAPDDATSSGVCRGSRRRCGQRMQACSWTQGVP